jgi:cytochrome c553
LQAVPSSQITRWRRLVALVLPLVALAPPPGSAEAEEPSWAYAVLVPGLDDPLLYTLPGSDRAFTRREILAPFGPADWFPLDHPPMPSVVAYGRPPDVVACALCHYPNGKGGPENAGIAGLPKDYFVRQMREFRSGERRSAVPLKADTSLMTTIAQGMTEDEIEDAARYYGSMPWTPWISVIETDTIPATRIQDGVHVEIETDGIRTESLARRIVEVPADPVRTRLRDPRSGFVAYVPVGSIEAGAQLARTGGGRTQPCATCHRQDLNGLGAAPGLRGRSPSYLARQLYDFQRGTRRGLMAVQMAPVAASLSHDDILNLAAYLASLEPIAAPRRR